VSDVAKKVETILDQAGTNAYAPSNSALVFGAALGQIEFVPAAATPERVAADQVMKVRTEAMPCHAVDQG
jgi:hypothetical protein